MTGPSLPPLADSLAAAVGELSPGRRLTETPVVAALVAIVAGAAWLGFLAAAEPPGDRSAEAGFARDMAVHHAQGVEVAELARGRTSDAEVRALATDIALTEQAQIGMFSGWLAAWGLPQNGPQPPMAWMGHPTGEPMPGMASRGEIGALQAATGVDADRLFLAIMVPHHKGALLMARAVLARTERPEVVRLARSIAAGQQAEIAAMESALVRLGASPVTTAVAMPVGEGGDHGHGEDFMGAVGPSARAARRFAPLAAGTFGAAWLMADGLRRRRLWGRGDRAPWLGGRRRGWRLAGVAALGLAGVAHLALVPEHFGVGASHGAFFVVAGCVQLAASAALLAWPVPRTWAAGASACAVLLAVYTASRLVAVPGNGQPEVVEALGLVVGALEAGVIALAVAVHRAPRSARPRL